MKSPSGVPIQPDPWSDPGQYNASPDFESAHQHEWSQHFPGSDLGTGSLVATPVKHLGLDASAFSSIPPLPPLRTKQTRANSEGQGTGTGRVAIGAQTPTSDSFARAFGCILPASYINRASSQIDIIGVVDSNGKAIGWRVFR